MIQILLSLFISVSALASLPTKTEQLKITAFSEEKTMGERWNAFMSLVKAKDKHSLPDIREALASPDWFMRDAALKAIVMVNKTEAVKAAKYVLKNDNSLIVRTSAVHVLKFVDDKSVGPDLWVALNDKKNFRKKQSLWIRPKIMTALIEIGDRNISNYKMALKDQDARIQKMAEYAIKKFSN